MLREVSQSEFALPRYEKAESRCRLIEIYMPRMHTESKHESVEEVGRQLAFDALVSDCS